MAAQGCGHLRHVVDGHQVDRIPPCKVARPLRFTRDDRDAAVERFGDHAPEGLVPRRAHEQVEGLVKILHVAAEAFEAHAVRDQALQGSTLAAIAHDDELRLRQLRLRERLQQHVEALARHDASDPADQEVVVSRAEFSTQLADSLWRQPRVRHERVRHQPGPAVVGGRHRRQLPLGDAEERVGPQVVRTVQMQVQRADVACRALDACDIACAAAQVRVNDVRPPLLDDLGESLLCAPPRRHLEDLDAGLEFVEQADARAVAVIAADDERDIVPSRQRRAGFHRRALRARESARENDIHHAQSTARHGDRRRRRE